MVRHGWCFIILFSLCLGLSAQAMATPESGDHGCRFAIVVGANNGGKERAELRYAVSDAQKVMDVLQKIGGVLPADSVLMIEPTRRSFLNGFNKLQPKLKDLKARYKKLELIFYYSGHSDEEALLLRGEKLYYREIRNLLTQLPADVRITILDSCSSGAFTRLKGGTIRPPFLEDSAYNMKGFAIMTSSSVDEASQESDRLRSSFFTHFLVTGLRGAADLTQDGRITLSEAYQYAYTETLAKTERTLSGPQHPNYDIQMTGTGDVIMTDIRTSSSVLVLDKAMQGRISVRDRTGQLVAELRKQPGRELRIGLENGDFTITNESRGRTYEALVQLEFGQQLSLTSNQFKTSHREVTVPRGNTHKDLEAEPQDEPFSNAKFQTTGYTVVPWHFSPYFQRARNTRTIHYYVFNLFGSYSAKLDGFSIGVGPCSVGENARGMQVSLIGNHVSGDMEGIQIADFFNQVDGHFDGVQLCDGINLAFDNAEGVQLAGFNFVSRQFKGFQVGYAGNYVGGDIFGSQLGVVNMAGNCNGFQCGLVNITGEQKGLSLGLINLAKNGFIDWTTWSDNYLLFNTGVRFRVNEFYSMIALGSQSVTSSSDNALAWSVRFGGHVPVKAIYFESDFGIGRLNHAPFTQSSEGDETFLQWRVLAGMPFSPGFSLFVGQGLNMTFSTSEEEGSPKVLKADLFPILFGGFQLSF